jgi:hypothetical protein
MVKSLARRRLLELVISAPLVAWGAAAEADPACVDMSALSDSEKSLRTSLNYRLVSDDPKRVCGGCSFFMAPRGDCGQCSILNGPTTDKGRCDSWAA